MSISSPKNCPQCGTPLQENAPGGLCPRCVMALNFQTQTVFTDEPAAMPSPPTPAELAPHFPQLEILECLGRGGMGVVYKARQPQLDRVVALKILAPERVTDARFADRFLREARALAKLNHPNIVTIHDFGQTGGYFYLLMELVDGVNLRELLREGRMAPREALAIVPAICEALQYAHDRGIIHRDIKPENILLDKDGRVKIADFGIARMLRDPAADETGTKTTADAAPGLTAESVLGTPKYMAPEQAEKSGEADHRADIYSLGVVFYEMLTGELPGKNLQPPSRKVHIDVRLDEIVLRALERKPELRYQQASALRTQVETIAADAGSATPPGGKSKFTWVNVWPPINGPFVVRRGGVRIVNWSTIGINLLCVLVLLPVLSPWLNQALGGRIASEEVLVIVAAAVVIMTGIRLLHGLLQPLHRLPEAKEIKKQKFSMASGVGVVIIIIVFLGGGYISAWWERHQQAREIKSDYIGQAWFPNGDSIEITTVKRTKDQMTVQGHYNLVSHDHASLQLHITTTTSRIRVGEGPAQDMDISKGSGDFKLVDSNLTSGLPHVSMYADGHSFASLYFGTAAEAADEGKATWISGSGTASGGETKSIHAFGPVIERVIQPRLDGTNLFLNLDSGQLLTPPSDVTNALVAGQSDHDLESFWKGLDIVENTRPFRYIAWLRDSGADLMFNGNGEIIAFGYTCVIAHGSTSTNWDDWSGLTPEMARTALKTIGSATANSQSGTTTVNLVPGSASYTSAKRLYSRYSKALTSDLLTRGQSVTWFFKTPKGGIGVLQIGFTDNTRGAMIRYKLVQPENSLSPQTSAATGISGASPTANGDRISKLFFSPVIEGTLQFDKKGGDFLVLRTGEVIHRSAVVTDGDLQNETSPSELVQWVREHEVDMALCPTLNDGNASIALLLFDMGICPFPYDTVPDAGIPRFHSTKDLIAYNAQHRDHPAQNPLVGPLAGVTNIWNDLTVEQLQGSSSEVAAIKLDFKIFTMRLDSATWSQQDILHHPVAFVTRNGIYGLLEITSFTTNPPVLKFRYKLVISDPSFAPQGKRPI